MWSRCLVAGLIFAGSANAGTVSSIAFSTTPSDRTVVLNGVRESRSEGFVLYQHGDWSTASAEIADEIRPGPVPSPAPQAEIATNPLQMCATRSIPRRSGLSSKTAIGRLAYWPVVRDAECRHGLPVGLLDALVIQESRYQPAAVSPAGAGGLTQLMPRTAGGLGVFDRFDPVSNVDGGARYLKTMLNRYRSVPIALAAYNAGPGSVDRTGGIPSNSETPGYVSRVLGYWNQADAVVVIPAYFSRAVLLSFSGSNQE